MKINKIILAISHFFGHRTHEEHIDNVSIRFPYLFLVDYHIDVSDAIKGLVYEKLELNKKLKRRCENIGFVYIIDDNSKAVEPCRYIDGVIYSRWEDQVAVNRALKLKELMD